MARLRRNGPRGQFHNETIAQPLAFIGRNRNDTGKGKIKTINKNEY